MPETLHNQTSPRSVLRLAGRTPGIRTVLLASVAFAAVLLFDIRPAEAGGAVRVTTVIVPRGSGGGASYSSRASRQPNPLLAEITRARAELARIAIRLRNEFNESPELLSARALLRSAALDFASARGTALADVRAHPDYRAAAERVVQLQRELDAAHRQTSSLSGASTFTDKNLTQIATELMKARSEVSRIETATLAANDAFTTVRYAYLDANGQLLAMIRDFNDSVVNNDEFLAAKERLDGVRAQLARR